MKLQSRIKTAQDRCVAPRETVARLEALIRPRHDFWVHHEELSPELHWTALFLTDEPDFRSMGKGVSADFSVAGALAEAAEWLIARDVHSFHECVKTHQKHVCNALRIEDLLAHVATATPRVIERVQALPAAQHWVEGWSLRDDRPVKVPLEYVRQLSGPNGKATGNYLEEAIVHATNEIFERRAHVTVLRDRMVVPTFDLATVKHPVLRRQIDFLRGQGIEIVLKDLSFGGVLPCVGAYFVDPQIPEEFQFRHFFKVGASFHREEALIRCFTEYVQGRRREEFFDPASHSGRKLEEVLAADFRRLAAQGNDCDNLMSAFLFGMVPYRDAGFLREGELLPFEPAAGFRDCLDDIAAARSICESLGKDYIAVDLTHPEVGFPVVQVIIPGYSDVLPYHPPNSRGLFRKWTRDEVIRSYGENQLPDLPQGLGQ